MPQRKPAYYFRAHFVAGFDKPEEFLLAATCTDDYGGRIYPLQVFLNGTEIVTSGLETVTGQGNEVRYFDLLAFAGLIVPGTNLIAVKVSNVWQSAWDDVAFDLSLRAIPASSRPINFSVRATAPGQFRLSAQTPLGSIWQAEISESIASGWQPLALFTNLTGASWEFLDSSQMGAPQPLSARFYRLRPY